jgi:hypothetical protein
MKKARLGAERALLLRSRFAEKSNRNRKYSKADRRQNKINKSVFY